jgi:thiopurine S-methyltransferase
VTGDFWHERWRTGQVGFHQKAVERNLPLLWPALELDQGSRVLVPLCGKSLDMLWLRDQGHPVLGVEVSDIALQAFCLENGVPARRRAALDSDTYEARNLELQRRDWFTVTAETLQSVSAVYDRAALIAWAPDWRERYVRHLAAATRSGTETLLITLDYPQSETAGPPFSVDGAEVERLYGADHRIRELARRDVLAEEPRMRAKGVTRIDEVCYRLTRL